ncbi:MAG: enoyl-CoA hydratase/isomerase family protein [Acidimicrobiia bacterium]
MSAYPDPVDGLIVAHDGPVLRLTLDRPARKNALTDDIVLALIGVFDATGLDESVRVIALTGTGDDFCSGFDLGQRSGSADTARPRVGSVQRRMQTHVNRLIPAMLETQVPIVATGGGWCIGLGLNLLLAADFAIVADDARLRAPFTSFGFTPDSGASWLLPRLVGIARAKEMLLLGREISGKQAAEWGLVHRAVESADLDAATAALVDELAAAATVAVGLTKVLVQRGLTTDLAHQLADEGLAMELSSRSDDFREYATSRRDKRPPDYQGR